MQSNEKFILAIDQSTQTTKVLIVGSTGKIYHEKRKSHKQIITNKNYIEHDPLEILNNTKELITNSVKEFCEKNHVEKNDIKCLGITNQRETLVVWDKLNGKPLYNAIVWNDCRTIPLCNKLIQKYKTKDYFQKQNGLLIDSYFSLFKFLWLLENVKEIKQKYDKNEILIGTIDTWLIYNLTQEKNHYTDVSNASRTFLMNLKDIKWDANICKEFNINQDILPEIKPNTFEFGTLNLKEFQHIKITGSIGDQQAAALAMGLCQNNKNQVKITYGTGIFMLISTYNKICFQEGLITTVIYQNEKEIFYGLEAAIESGGQTLNFLEKNMGIKVWELDKEIQQENKFFENEIFVGSFGRLMAPFWRNTKGGFLCNLSYESTSKDLYRAMLESIAFRVFQCIQHYSDKIDQIKVDGGMSKNNYLMKFQSIVLKKELNVFQNKDCTVLGAAMASGLFNIIQDQQKFLNKNLNSFEKIYQEVNENEQQLINQKLKEFQSKIDNNWANQLQ